MAERTCSCAHCGALFTAKRSDAVACSPRCNHRLRNGAAATRACLGCGSNISNRMGNAKYCEPCADGRSRVHEATRKAKASMNTACVGCGVAFATPSSKRYCDLRCAGRTNRAKQLAVTLTKICGGCGEAFTTNDNRRSECSIACNHWVRSHPGRPRRLNRPCVTCGQPMPRTVNVGAKYCGSDCRPASRRSGRHTMPLSTRRREIDCAFCGVRFMTHQTKRKYCSEWCGSTGYNSQTEETAYARRLGRTCERCGTAIPKTARVDKRFCTESCQVCFNQELRRARKRGLPSEPISRAEIFARDNYTCHICMKPIKDKPVLDHLIPLAHKNSPGHVKENVAAAHAFCNGSKNARVRPEDYDLYIRLSLGGSVCA